MKMLMINISVKIKNKKASYERGFFYDLRKVFNT